MRNILLLLPLCYHFSRYYHKFKLFTISSLVQTRERDNRPQFDGVKIGFCYYYNYYFITSRGLICFSYLALTRNPERGYRPLLRC